MIKRSTNTVLVALAILGASISTMAIAQELVKPKDVVQVSLRADKAEQEARTLKAQSDIEEAALKRYKIRRERRLLMLSDMKLGIQPTQSSEPRGQEQSNSLSVSVEDSQASYQQINSALLTGKTTVDKDGIEIPANSGLMSDVNAEPEHNVNPIDFMCVTKVYGREGSMKADVWMQGKKYPSLTKGAKLPENITVKTIIAGSAGWGAEVSDGNVSHRLSMCGEDQAREMGGHQNMDFDIAQPL